MKFIKCAFYKKSVFIALLGMSYIAFGQKFSENVSFLSEKVKSIELKKNEIDIQFTSKKTDNLSNDMTNDEFLFSDFQDKDFQELLRIKNLYTEKSRLAPFLLEEIINRYQSMILKIKKYEKAKKLKEDFLLGLSFQDKNFLSDFQIKTKEIIEYFEENFSLASYLIDLSNDLIEDNLSKPDIEYSSSQEWKELSRIKILQKSIADVSLIKYYDLSYDVNFEKFIKNDFILRLKNSLSPHSGISDFRKTVINNIEKIFAYRTQYDTLKNHSNNRYTIEIVDIFWERLEDFLKSGLSILDKQNQNYQFFFQDLKHFFSEEKQKEKIIDQNIIDSKKILQTYITENILLLQEEEKKSRNRIFSDENKDIPFQKLQHYSQLYHAILLGDQYFSAEKVKEAIKQYLDALGILKSLDKKIEEKLRYAIFLRLQYRIVWTYYRLGDWNQLEFFSKEILSKERIDEAYEKIEESKKIISDTIKVLSDSLFERDDESHIWRTLSDHTLKTYAENIGVQIMKKYIAIGQNQKSISLGKKLIEHSSLLSEDVPFVWYFLFKSYEKNKNEQEKEKLFEKIWNLFSKDSLWRKQYQNNTDLVSSMEELLGPVCSEYGFLTYSHARKKNDKNLYFKSYQIFSDLISEMKQHKKMQEWSIFEAHSLFFSQKYTLALNAYKNLLTDQTLKEESKEMILYHIFLTYKSLDDLGQLELSVKEYEQNFPNLSKTIDIKLVAADIFLKKENFHKAMIIWNDVLSKASSFEQRKQAISQIIVYEKKNKTLQSFILSLKKILLRELWPKDDRLRKEILKVLYQSSQDYMEDLESKGMLKDSADFSLSLADLFIDIPGRRHLYKRSAFSFAILGEWSLTKSICERIFEKNEKDPELFYLYAKALEYHFDFYKAHVYYGRFYRKWPKHQKSKESLIKSKELESAEQTISSHQYGTKKELSFDLPFPWKLSDE